jgi:glucokinase
VAQSAGSERMVLAVDLGGTSIKGALVDAQGELRHELARPTPVPDGSEAITDALDAMVMDLAREAEVLAVSVVVPGVLDLERGRVVFAGNLGLRDTPLRERLAALTGLPTVLEHDVRAAGVAERTVGAARGSADHIIVVCGTGVAASVSIGGEVVIGAHGVAGEFGHLPVWPEGEECPCGQRGCLERYASAGAIARHYVERGGESGVSAREVLQRRAEDPAAAWAWSQACEALGIALSGAAALLDPSLIVVSGGLSEAGEALLEPVRALLTARLGWRAVVPELRRSPLGGRAGVLGAAVLGWRHAARLESRGTASSSDWYSPITS